VLSNLFYTKYEILIILGKIHYNFNSKRLKIMIGVPYKKVGYRKNMATVRAFKGNVSATGS
jgi:hypothetical protein